MGVFGSAQRCRELRHTSWYGPIPLSIADAELVHTGGLLQGCGCVDLRLRRVGAINRNEPSVDRQPKAAVPEPRRRRSRQAQAPPATEAPPRPSAAAAQPPAAAA